MRPAWALYQDPVTNGLSFGWAAGWTEVGWWVARQVYMVGWMGVDRQMDRSIRRGSQGHRRSYLKLTLLNSNSLDPKSWHGVVRVKVQ